MSLFSQKTRPYFVLILLTAIFTSNYADRIIVGVYGEAIKADLAISDTQLGLLTGFAFALFYATLGIPMGRLADRYNRKYLLAACLLLWSLTTALSGIAQNFAQLLLLRMLVGVGEAGCIPIGNSMLTDLFEARKRAMAISVFSAGPPMGILVGAIGGGWLGEYLGWRGGIVTMGVSGVFLALILLMAVNEPKRGAYDEDRAKDEPAPPFIQCLRTFAGDPVFRFVTAGLACSGMALYSLSAFTVPFLIRGYDLSMFEAATIFGLSYGIAGVLGAAVGGSITGWASSFDMRWYAGVPAIAYAVSGVLLLGALFQPDSWFFIAMFAVGSFVFNIGMAPTSAVVLNRMEPRMCATAAATLMMIAATVALSLGPTLTGFLSDKFASARFQGAGDFGSVCQDQSQVLEGSSLAASCAAANFDGLQTALAIVTSVLFVASLVYIGTMRHLRVPKEAQVSAA